MSYILALFLPWLAVILKSRILTGVVLGILQLTLVGWIPASIVAMFVISSANNKKVLQEALKDAQG